MIDRACGEYVSEVETRDASTLVEIIFVLDRAAFDTKEARAADVDRFRPGVGDQILQAVAELARGWISWTGCQRGVGIAADCKPAGV